MLEYALTWRCRCEVNVHQYVETEVAGMTHLTSAQVPLIAELFYYEVLLSIVGLTENYTDLHHHIKVGKHVTLIIC